MIDRDAAPPAELVSRLHDTCCKAGFAEYSFLVHQVPIGVDHRSLSEWNLCRIDENWVQVYDESRWIHHDPVQIAASQSFEPVISSVIELSSGYDLMPRHRREFFNQAHKFGYTNAVAIPFHGPSGTLTTLTLLTRSPFSDFPAYWASVSPQVVPVARTFHSRFSQAVQSLIKMDTLSPRELQVLSLCALGYENKQIAHRLGTSRHTVDKHISNIQAKLGTRNKTHSVAVALTRGVIRPNGYVSDLLGLDD